MFPGLFGLPGFQSLGRGLGLPTKLDVEIEPLQLEGVGFRGMVCGCRLLHEIITESPWSNPKSWHAPSWSIPRAGAGQVGVGIGQFDRLDFRGIHQHGITDAEFLGGYLFEFTRIAGGEF